MHPWNKCISISLHGILSCLFVIKCGHRSCAPGESHHKSLISLFWSFWLTISSLFRHHALHTQDRATNHSASKVLPCQKCPQARNWIPVGSSGAVLLFCYWPWPFCGGQEKRRCLCWDQYYYSLWHVLFTFWNQWEECMLILLPRTAAASAITSETVMCYIFQRAQCTC